MRWRTWEHLREPEAHPPPRTETWRNGKRWKRLKEAGVSEGRLRLRGAGDRPPYSQFSALLYWKKGKSWGYPTSDHWLFSILTGGLESEKPSWASHPNALCPKTPGLSGQGGSRRDSPCLLNARRLPASTTRFSQPSLAGLDRIQLGHTPQRFSG